MYISGSNSRSQEHLRDDSDVRYIVHPGDVEEEDIIDFRLAGSNSDMVDFRLPASNSNLLHLDSVQPVRPGGPFNPNHSKITSI